MAITIILGFFFFFGTIKAFVRLVEEDPRAKRIELLQGMSNTTLRIASILEIIVYALFVYILWDYYDLIKEG